MRIKYMFIMQEYGLMSAAAGGFLPRMCCIVGLGGSDPEGRGGLRLRQATLLSPPMALTASSTF
jgi:hypothetical protein